MSSRWFTRLLLATLAGVFVSSAPALADPSGRVARISFIGGSVSFRPASLDEWSLASLNYPLTIGDHVWLLVGVALSCLLAGALAAAFLVRELRRPIRSLVGTIDQLGDGDYTQPVAAATQHEFTELSEAVCRMPSARAAT